MRISITTKWNEGSEQSNSHEGLASFLEEVETRVSDPSVTSITIYPHHV